MEHTKVKKLGAPTTRCWFFESSYRKDELHLLLPAKGHGWELVNGKCRPVRNSVLPLPEQLRDIGSSNESSDESSDDERSEYGISSSLDEE